MDGIDEIGEIELQAFYIGNLGLRHAALIVALSFPWVLLKSGASPRAFRDLMRRLKAAHRRGKETQNILLLPYEKLWSEPLAELAARICPSPA